MIHRWRNSLITLIVAVACRGGEKKSATEVEVGRA